MILRRVPDQAFAIRKRHVRRRRSRPLVVRDDLHPASNETHASHIRQSSLSRSRAPSRDRPTPPRRPTSRASRRVIQFNTRPSEAARTSKKLRKMVSTARADLASPVARDRASPAPAPPFARAYFLLASHRVTVVVRVESRAPAPRSFAAHRRNAHRAPSARDAIVAVASRRVARRTCRVARRRRMNTSCPNRCRWPVPRPCSCFSRVKLCRRRAFAPARRRAAATRRDATARGVGIAISIYVRVNALWM